MESKSYGMRAVRHYVGLLCFMLALSQCWSFGEKWKLVIRNELPGKETLFLHCRSDEDDLGGKWLPPGDNREWSFRQNFWETTKFWCIMRRRHAHVEIDVYWDDNTPNREFFHKCNDEKCIWMAREDGIYLRNIPANRDEFQHAWKPGWGHGYI